MTEPPDPYAAQPGTPPPGYGAPPPGYGPPPGFPPPSDSAGGPYAGYGALPGAAAAMPGAFTGYASWGQRAGALLIDSLIGTAIYAVAFVVAAVLSSASEALGVLVLVAGYAAGLGFAIWQMVVQGRTGQTIGKKALGIKLVREADGQVVGVGTSIGRFFVHFLDAIPCYVGYLWPLWDAKRQTFADKILQTLVVRA